MLLPNYHRAMVGSVLQVLLPRLPAAALDAARASLQTAQGGSGSTSTAD